VLRECGRRETSFQVTSVAIAEETSSAAPIAAHSSHEDVGVSLVLFSSFAGIGSLTTATLRSRREVSHEPIARDISY
jgi:hypothetical protein